MSQAGDGQFRSSYTNEQLYALVRKAAITFGAPRPHKLSTRKFDAARDPLGHPKAPTARWIAQRLEKPWPEVVKLSLDEKRDFTMTDAAASRTPAAKWLDLRHLHFALNFVARRRGQKSFSAHDYEVTREEALKADNEGTLSTILPTSGQLIQIVRRIEKAEAEQAAGGAADADAALTTMRGKKAKPPNKKRELLPELSDADPIETLDEAELQGLWNRALALASLEPYKQARVEGVSVAKAIDLYIEASGLLPPTYSELRRFAGIAGFSLSRPDKGEAIRHYLPEVAAARSKRGLSMADVIAEKDVAAFDLSKLPADLPGAPPGRDEWSGDEERVIKALCEYLDSVAARHLARPTRADYLKVQPKQPIGRWPAASTLGRIGPKSFSGWIKKAQAAQQKARKSAA